MAQERVPTPVTSARAVLMTGRLAVQKPISFNVECSLCGGGGLGGFGGGGEAGGGGGGAGTAGGGYMTGGGTLGGRAAACMN